VPHCRFGGRATTSRNRCSRTHYGTADLTGNYALLSLSGRWRWQIDGSFKHRWKKVGIDAYQLISGRHLWAAMIARLR
jgi:hypothetical protein